jgi:lipid A 3-O-deacylase
MVRSLLLPLIACLAFPSPARAGELFGGVYVHDIDSPLTKSGIEEGVDVQLGYRWDRIGRTPLQPYLFGALNTSGETHYAVAGLSAKFGKRFYIRPGLGIAIHSGDNQDFEDPFDDDVEFGTSVLFAPEVGIGFSINERASVEASLVHLSHAQIFGGQNPGIDNVGIRFNWKF